MDNQTQIQEHTVHKYAGCCLSAWGLGIALGLIWAISLLLIHLMSFIGVGFSPVVVKLIGMVYGATGISGLGIILGVLWAFLDGFVTGLVIAWLYNLVLCCWPCKKKYN